MTDFNDLAARYIATWNESDDAARRAALEQLWAPDGSYVDPVASATGPEQINAMIAAVRSQFPGFEFRLAGPVDGHHEQCRFTWELASPSQADGEAPVVGFDVALAGDDDRLRAVLGFLDRVPAAVE